MGTYRRSFWIGVVVLAGAAQVWASLPLTVTMDRQTLHISEPGSAIVIRVSAPDDAPLHAQVVNANGWVVSPLQSVGEGVYAWNGMDQEGRPVKAGTYFIQVESGGDLWSSFIAVAK